MRSGESGLRIRPLVLVAIVIFTCVIGATTNASGSSPSVPADALGVFAGYSWFGSPRTISAEWRIPGIEGNSSGTAGTWIGVQSPSNPFVQIGTNEISMDGTSNYVAFWSDDTEEFHPQFFGPRLRAGDLISASITVATGGWRLHLRDMRSGTTFSRTISMATNGFNEAEWLQEDVSGPQHLPLPYPKLSTTEFSNLRINGRPPSLNLSNATWMSVPAGDYSPTPLVNDSFHLVPVHLNAAQSHFIAENAPYKAAAMRFDAIQGTWSGHPPSATTAEATLKPFMRALNARVQALETGDFPSVPKADIDALAAALESDGKALSAEAHAEPSPGASVVATLVRTRENLRTAKDRVNGDLRLPG